MNIGFFLLSSHTRTCSKTALILTLILAMTLLLFSGCSPNDISPLSSTGMTPAKTQAISSPVPTESHSSSTIQSSGEAVESTSSSINGPTSANPGLLPFSEDDLLITVLDTTSVLLEDAAPLLTALGDDCQVSEAESCVYVGMDKTFDYGSIIVYTVPSGEKDLLDGVDIMDDRAASGRGIRVGNSRDDVLAAYGPQAGTDSDLVYNQSGDIENLADPKLTFIMDGDTVSAISFYSGSNALE